MNTKFQTWRDHANSGGGVVKVLITGGCIALIGILALPEIAGRHKRQSERAKCINNLKQIGLASICWQYDNDLGLPWTVPMSSNGVKELATSGNVAALFRAMTNHQMLSGKILACPSDKNRNPEPDVSKFANHNVSYFIRLDHDTAFETELERTRNDGFCDPMSRALGAVILFGDRNISGGILASNRVMEVRATNILAWGNDVHVRAGNVGMADGSVLALDSAELQQCTQSRVPTLRFALP